MLLSVNHEQLLMQISRSRERNNGGTLKEFGPVFFFLKKSENQDTRAIFSTCHFADKFTYEYVARCFSNGRFSLAF